MWSYSRYFLTYFVFHFIRMIFNNFDFTVLIFVRFVFKSSYFFLPLLQVVGQGGTLHYCQLPECKEGELVPVICPGCSKKFCLRHRHQVRLHEVWFLQLLGKKYNFMDIYFFPPSFLIWISLDWFTCHIFSMLEASNK